MNIVTYKQVSIYISLICLLLFSCDKEVYEPNVTGLVTEKDIEIEILNVYQDKDLKTLGLELNQKNKSNYPYSQYNIENDYVLYIEFTVKTLDGSIVVDSETSVLPVFANSSTRRKTWIGLSGKEYLEIIEVKIIKKVD